MPHGACIEPKIREDRPKNNVEVAALGAAIRVSVIDVVLLEQQPQLADGEAGHVGLEPQF